MIKLTVIFDLFFIGDQMPFIRVLRFEQLPGIGTVVPGIRKVKKAGSGPIRKTSPRTGTVKVSDKYEIVMRKSNYLILEIEDT